MKLLTIPAALLFLASLGHAQQGTSPSGFLQVEGNDNYNSTFGYYGTNSTLNTCYTAIDGSNTGTGRAFHTLSLRRDGGSPTDSGYVARTVTMAIRMAHGDYSHVANNDNNPEASLLKSGWSIVFKAKTVNLPNWANAPVSGTAPFDLTFPLDSAFPYNGVDAIVFQFQCTPSNLSQSALFPIDAQEVLSYSEGAQTHAGVGCVAAGRTTPMRHYSYLYNYGPVGKSVWQLWASLAPANAPVVFVVGNTNPNLQVGACERLLASPVLVLTGDPADATGFATLTLGFQHQDSMIGTSLYSQAIAVDASQPGVPFALSDGVRATYPANPKIPQAIASGTQRSASPTFPTSSFLFKGTAIVIGLGF